MIAILLALGASVAWAGANVYIQRTARELGSLRGMLWAQILGTVVMVPAALLVDGAPSMPPLGALLLTGLGSAAGYYGMLRAFEDGPLSVVTPVLASWALPAAAIGVLWLGEAPRAVQIAGALCVIAGAAGNGALTTGGEWRADPRRTLGWAVVGAVGFGLMAAGIAAVRPFLGAVGVIPAVWLVQWLMLLPLLLRSPAVFHPPVRWPNVAAMAALEALGFGLYSGATALAPVSVVSPPASVAAVVTVLYAATAMGERVGALRWACVGLVTGGTVLLAG